MTPHPSGPLVASALALAAPLAAQEAPAPAERAPAVRPPRPAETPLDERTAVLGALDKRQGTTAEFTLKPGERFAFGRLQGILRSCERTQPHELPQSGAFVQLSETPAPRQGQPAAAPRLIFSGWLFAESPSLNPMRHPVYDVWLKSCTMRFPDGPPIPRAAPDRTSAGKRARAAKPTAAESPPPAAPVSPPAATPG
jgi:hypothetical protein